MRRKFPKAGQKRKLDESPENPVKKEIEVDSDNEVSFNVPQAKKLKTDSDVAKKPEENKPKVEDTEEEKPRRSPNGYILPDPLPEGLIIKDLRNKKWKIGKSIGLGGFGEIYSAALFDGKSITAEDYVVKVEPHSNGPLFVELHFYCRATKKEDLDSFAASRKIKHLGVPDLKGHGSFMHRKKKLRFIVMPRYGKDLQTKLDESKSNLSIEETSSIATQVINSLEYLHSQGYVHKDLKGNNMIFTRDQKGSNDKIFLVDYGLASRYIHMGIHRPFEPDQRSAHEGTLEYVSRDGHLGCVSRRGDMECLLYVAIEWMGGHLPWDTDDDERLKPNIIQQMKIEAFHDIKGFLTYKAFKNKTYPPVLEDLMNAVKKMRFEDAPDYNHIRSLFRPYLPAKIDNSDMEIGENNNKENLLYDISEDEEIDFKSPIVKKPSKRRSLPLALKRQQSVSQPWSPNQMQVFTDMRNQIIRNECSESLKNPTPAMKEQLERMHKRNEGLLPNFFTTRRKGLVVGKRRLQRKNSTGSNEGDKDILRGTLQKTPMKKEKPLTVRRSPRSTNNTFGQHLYGIVNTTVVGPVSNLVKSILSIQTKLRPRPQGTVGSK